MEKTENITIQSSGKDELSQRLEEVILLLGVNSKREIEKIKEFLVENQYDLIRTIKDFITSTKQQTKSYPVGQTLKGNEERKETLQEKIRSDNKYSSNFSLMNDYPEIQIVLKVKSASSFISSYEETKGASANSKNIQFSKEFMEKVKESFSKNNEKPEEENSKSNKPQNKSKFEKKAQDFKKNMNKKRSNFNNQNNYNNTKNNNQKYGNNNKGNEEDYYEVNYLGDSNNSYNNIPGYNKKNSNYNKNKGYNNNGKSSNYNNGYANDSSDTYNKENTNSNYKNGGFNKKNNYYGKNKHYN